MEQNVATRHKSASFATSAGGLSVYPLWSGGVQDALRKFGAAHANLPRKLAVAAVLPDQVLDLNEMDALEEAGLLVIEVPQAARSYEAKELAEFVEGQIDGPDSITDLADAAPPAVALSGVAIARTTEQALTDEEEAALLHSINDPDADEGGV